MSTKNVDDLLSQRTQEILNPNERVEPVELVERADVQVDSGEHVAPEHEEAPTYEDNSPTNEVDLPSNDITAEQAPSEKIDEYGERIASERMYTQKEVQEMIRDRLRRGNHDQVQPTQQQVQQAADGFKPDPDSEASWEQQLDSYIDRRLDKRERSAKEKQWQVQEKKIQDEFEDKFSRGMSNYDDFSQVVAGKPITDSMMLGARSLEDPAAFIYAASKHHSKELERIARIPDPYQQATEIGRLEMKMRKPKVGTNAPKPIPKAKGDMQFKSRTKNNIDDLIRKDAQRKFRQGR